MSSISYRPDIDGLRAVAVLSVVLFHTGVPLMSGGYVGVDIFFVISGYLITSLMLKDMNAGSFTIGGFWVRRFRRILPALFVMVAGTMLAGWFLLLPDDYKSLGAEVMSQAAFGSNILFYKQAGYFDQGALLKPLLHTWSLAVEEQFYIFYPLALVFVWAEFRARLGQFIVLSAVVSFVLCVIVLNNNQNLTFYMLPFRGWELLCGALVAYYGSRWDGKISGMQAQAAAVFCFLLMIVPVFFYSEETLFPGWTALPSCLGASGLIFLHRQQRTIVSHLLSFRPIVFVGLISYSLYLWHWPVLVFIKYNPFMVFEGIAVAFYALAISAFAVLSYYFVERPVRNGTLVWPDKKVFIHAGAAIAFLMMCSATMYTLKGIPARLPENVVRYAEGINDQNPMRSKCDKTPIDKIERGEVCQTEGGTKPVFMLWGDSHADAIAPAFYALSEEYRQKGYVATAHGCPPLLGYNFKTAEHGAFCYASNKAVYDFILRSGIKRLYLVASWDSWMKITDEHPEEFDWTDVKSEGSYERPLFNALHEMVSSLKKKGITVYLLKDVPWVSFDPPRTLAFNALYNQGRELSLTSRKDYEDNIATHIDQYLVKDKDLHVIDAVDAICPDDKCLVEKDGYSLYYNQGHLSARGAVMMKDIFRPSFEGER